MAKITFLKKVRKLNPVDKDGNSFFVDPAYAKDGVPKGMYDCPVCGHPMLIATGQIMGCHCHCRKDYKAMLRNMQEHEQRRTKKE